MSGRPGLQQVGMIRDEVLQPLTQFGPHILG
jgi:hypothetical protein